MDCSRLAQEALPSSNGLAEAFVRDFSRVSSFYRRLPGTPEEWRERWAEVRARHSLPRSELLAALHSLHRELPAAEAVRRNLALLEDADTVTVVTGQQVGVLGGPALTLYKAATAVRLAERLRKWGIPAVPVFWLATEDSDYDEVARTWFPGEDEMIEVVHPAGEVQAGQMAGTVGVAPWEQWLGQNATLLDSCVEARWVRELLLDAYAPGRSLGLAFAWWLQRVFEGEGLLCFDPLRLEFTPSLLGFYRTAVTRRDELVGQVLQRNRELTDRGFAPQVRVDADETFLFWVSGNRRWKLEWKEGRFQAKGRRSWNFDAAELPAAVERGEGRLAPSALLRPVLQDFVLSAAAAVVGPAELAYFAQVSALEKEFGIRTLPYPRLSVTVVDRKSARLLERYGFSVPEILTGDRGGLLERALQGDEVGHLLDRVVGTRREVAAAVAALQRELVRVDPVAAGMLERAAPRMDYHFEKVRRRLLERERVRRSVAYRHVSRLLAALAPAGGLQERRVNANWVLAMGGPEVIRELPACCKVGAELGSHWVCRVSP
ncbi:MAG: bacillithiol biosynthesis cysteine-adding enzyme BshC [Acidobacteriota bacterium]